MAWSTLEQLKAAMRAKNPAQEEALRREDDALREKYPGRQVAYIDEWNDDELTRTIVIVEAEDGVFYEKLNKVPPEVRVRLRRTRILAPGQVSPESTLEQLKALRAKTPAQK